MLPRGKCTTMSDKDHTIDSHTSTEVADDGGGRSSLIKHLSKQERERLQQFSLSECSSCSDSSIPTLLSENSSLHEDFDDRYKDSLPPVTFIISDHATSHPIDWKEPLGCPCLDDYHPLNDFMPDLLRDHCINPRDVVIVADNAILLDDNNNANADSDDVSLDSLQAIEEVDERKAHHALSLEDCQKEMMLDSLWESFDSIDLSEQNPCSIKKDNSPTSVLDACFNDTSMLKRIGLDLFVLEEEDEERA